jgi:hypothetical protein
MSYVKKCNMETRTIQIKMVFPIENTKITKKLHAVFLLNSW